MPVFINNTKYNKPIKDGHQLNAVLDSNQVWPHEPYLADIDDLVFSLDVEGVQVMIPSSGCKNIRPFAFHDYDWLIDWGDGTPEQPYSGPTGSAEGDGTASITSRNIPYNYKDGKLRHTVKIMPNGSPKKGWLDAFGTLSLGFSKLKNIVRINSQVTPYMRTEDSSSHYQIFKGLGVTELPENLFPETAIYGNAGQYNSSCFDQRNLLYIPETFFKATSLGNSCYRRFFQSCYNLRKIPEKLFSWQNITVQPAYDTLAFMFQGCKELRSLPPELLNKNNGTVAIIPPNETQFQFMFEKCEKLTKIPRYFLSNDVTIKSGKKGPYAAMFSECTELTDIGNIDLEWLNDRPPQTGMFYGCVNIKTPITYDEIPSGWKEKLIL
jgi:hypothetical protein